MSRPRNRKFQHIGFTLVELLIVIAMTPMLLLIAMGLVNTIQLSRQQYQFRMDARGWRVDLRVDRGVGWGSPHSLTSTSNPTADAEIRPPGAPAPKVMGATALYPNIHLLRK